MKIWKWPSRLLGLGICTCLLSSGIPNVRAEYLPLRSDVGSEGARIDLLQSGSDELQFEVRLGGLELLKAQLEGRTWDRVEIPGGGLDGELGAPEIPYLTRLIVLPPESGARVEFSEIDVEVLGNINLMPAQGMDPEDFKAGVASASYRADLYAGNNRYPQERISLGEPAVMRGTRVASLRMNPVQYNPAAHELRVAHRFRVTVHFEGRDARNIPSRPVPLSRSWARLMQASVINHDQLELDEQVMGSYLIVCENDANLINNLLPPLVDWKKRKGHSVAIQTFAPGANNSAILGLIQNAYNTWEIPPEYVLLFGDISGDYPLPGWEVSSWPFGSDQIDHPYSQLDGGDILADVAVGRLPAGDASEAATMINKVLFYEKMPYTSNSDWFHQGVLIAGNSASGISTIQLNRWIKTRMIWNEYTRIDTFWYNMSGSVAGTLTPALNNGVLYAHYRGNYQMQNFYVSSIDGLTNGRKLPFVVTITCGTGGFAGSTESFMEHFVSVGTPTTPKGAIAAVGTATSNTHTRQNNTISYGIFAGIFDEGITQAGNALNRGKLELYNTYQSNDPGSVTDFSKWAALAGDPGVELFTHAIQYLSSNDPDAIPYGQNSLSLTVSEPGVGPVPDAVVCLYKANEIQSVGSTDANGQVTLPLNVTSTGNVKVTITKQNYFPIVDSLDVVQQAVAVGYYSHTIDDDNLGGSSGDGDQIINPGETIQVPVVLKNYGASTTATGVILTASERDAYISLSNAAQSFPNLAPGATANSSGSLLLGIAPDCPHGHTIQLSLLTNCAQGSWNGEIDLPVVSYDVSVQSAYAAGSDTLLSPGETANFILSVRNNGGKNAASLNATLTSLDSYVSVNDASASFGNVNIGAAASCSGNPFNLSASANAPPGHPADLKITFSANGATQTDTITVALGAKNSTDPQGPDGYGYYCFDNTDVNYAQMPTYGWLEIDPASGGSGSQLGIDDPYENSDMSVVVNLPFTFRFYGQDYSAITVCSNGWLAMIADNSFADFRNYPIPSPVGPNGMIAPFWDDLVTWSGGHVCTKNDVADHRFIVEWSRMRSLAPPQPQQTFEVVLYDPAYYPTSTGDGKILMQYNTVSPIYGLGDDNPYSTVGIESHDQQDGIEVCYWNSYDPGAAPLVSGRAYLFTPDFTYSLPGADFFVTLVPFGAPIILPASGGTVNYNITGGNNGPVPAAADIWSVLTLPNGSSYGPVLGPIMGYPFPANWSISRDRTLSVPAGAPSGTYTYHAYIGSYPAIISTQDAFAFTKLSGRGDIEGSGGMGEWLDSGEPFTVDAVGLIANLPQSYALNPAHPNPFNPKTAISYQLPASGFVALRIYDTAGRLVATLVNGWREAGLHEATFDASGLPSGIYLYRLQAGDFQATGKMVLVK